MSMVIVYKLKLKKISFQATRLVETYVNRTIVHLTRASPVPMPFLAQDRAIACPIRTALAIRAGVALPVTSLTALKSTTKPAAVKIMAFVPWAASVSVPMTIGEWAVKSPA